MIPTEIEMLQEASRLFRDKEEDAAERAVDHGRQGDVELNSHWESETRRYFNLRLVAIRRLESLGVSTIKSRKLEKVGSN